MNRRDLIKGIGVAIMAARAYPFIPGLIPENEIVGIYNISSRGKPKQDFRYFSAEDASEYNIQRYEIHYSNGTVKTGSGSYATPNGEQRWVKQPYEPEIIIV